MQLEKVKPKKCSSCGLLLQAHYELTYFIISEWNEEYEQWEQTYKDVKTGKNGNVEYKKLVFTCNNDKCPNNK